MKVGMLILMAHNLSDVVEFYQKMGFKLAFHLKDRWAEFIVENIKIGICPTDHEPFDRSTGIVFEVQDLYKIYNDLKTKGIEFMSEPKEAAHGIMVGFKDPSGNISDIYQATPEKIEDILKQQKEATHNDNDGCCEAKAKSCQVGDACSGCKDGGPCC